MDVSAAETGAMPLHRSKFDFAELVTEAADLYREVAEDKRIGIEVATVPAPVEADPVRLRQALANLIDNALKYTPEGGRVRLAVRPDGEAVVAEISDSGPGVPVEGRGKSWRRVDRCGAGRSQRGLGVGLSLVKAIVEAHRGTVAVDAAPEGGARFTLRLPARA